jgi:hypothetical protein
VPNEWRITTERTPADADDGHRRVPRRAAAADIEGIRAWAYALLGDVEDELRSDWFGRPRNPLRGSMSVASVRDVLGVRAEDQSSHE